MGENLRKGAVAGIFSSALLSQPANAYMDSQVAAIEAKIPMLNGGKAKDPPADMKEYMAMFEALNPEQEAQVRKDIQMAVWDEGVSPNSFSKQPDPVKDATFVVANGYLAYSIGRYAWTSIKVEQAKKAREVAKGGSGLTPAKPPLFEFS